MEEYLKQIFGDYPASHYLAFLTFTIIGLVIIKMIRYQKKKKSLAAANPPVYITVNWKEWWANNTIDVFLAVLLSFACFRFFPHALRFLNVPEEAEKMAYGFVLGLGLQYVTHLIFNKVNFMPHEHDENCNH